MPRLNRFVVCAVAAGLVASAEARPAPKRVAKDPEVWVTIASSDLTALQETFGSSRLAKIVTTYESRGGLTVGLVRESRLGDLSAAMHQRFQRCAGFMAHATRDEALDALDATGPTREQPAVTYTIDNAAVVNALKAQVSPANVAATITMLSGHRNRYYNESKMGVLAVRRLKQQWEGYAAGRSDVSVAFFPHTQWSQPSLVATITGTTFPNEIVVIGGHVDSINTSASTALRPAALAPGADDDASGVASLTEAFRAAMATGFRPQRTVKFMAYAAEEVGLRGSAEIAQAHLNASAQVIGVLQLDMTNYKRVSPPATVDMGVLTDTNWTDAPQNQFLRDLIAAYMAPDGITSQNTTCGYACSDHASWKQRGYPASLVFEAVFGQHSSNLHTVNDTLANADATGAHGAKFSRLAAAYMAELAKGVLVP
jgi:bacterial leucyl aminopeptidase